MLAGDVVGVLEEPDVEVEVGHVAKDGVAAAVELKVAI